MFKGCSLGKIDVIDIINRLNQEDLFLKYMGVYPDTSKKYYSPFRYDKSPGCRFKWYNGLLYFVENTMFNNKLYWTIFDYIAYQSSCSFKEALEIVAKDFDISTKPIISRNTKQLTSRPDIKFTKQEWPDQNLFFLDGSTLESEYIFLVKDYWIGHDVSYKCNSIHNPRKTTTIAYYFPDSGHVKLYFPEQKENRWYSNCDNTDIFGKYKLKQYLSESKDLIITKSQKDRMILVYKYHKNAIALQNEGCFIPDNAMDYLKENFNLTIVFDNDSAGYNAAEKLSKKYFISNVLFPNEKDVYETFIKQKDFAK